jgi:hypothetical protein
LLGKKTAETQRRREIRAKGAMNLSLGFTGCARTSCASPLIFVRFVSFVRFVIQSDRNVTAHLP